MKRLPPLSSSIFFALVAASLVFRPGARAATWDGANPGDWNTAANWTPDGVPNGVDAIVNSGEAQISANAPNPNDLRVNDTNAGTATVTQSAGSITVNAWTRFGTTAGGTGVYNLNGGTLTANSRVNIGEGGTGTLNITNGTFNINDVFNVNADNIAGGTGTVNQSGGIVNKAAGNWFAIGQDPNGGTGTYNLSGNGTLNSAVLVLVGDNGVGFLNISGASTLNANAGVLMGSTSNAASSGTLNLNGGTLTVTGTIAKGTSPNANAATFNFNGGTLKAGADSTTFMQGLTVANVLAGGAIIDTNGKAITINQPLIGDAANRLLTKNGVGTLTLGGSGDNISIGATVNTGSLVLAKTSSGGVHALGGATTVNNGGTLQLAGSGDDQIWTGVTVALKSGGTFDMNGRNEGFTMLNDGGGTGGTVTNSAASTTSTLTLGENNGTGSFSGVIQNGGASAIVALTKTGTGTLTLTNSNTYTGATTINANGGSITAGAAGALGGTASVTINTGGTLLLSGANNVDRINNSAPVTINGTFNTGGLNEGPAGGASGSAAAMGPLTLSANSTIDFTSGTGSNLLFASLSYTPGDIVSIRNWSGTIVSDTGSASNDRLLFIAPPGFSDSQLQSFQFYNDSGVAFPTGATLIPFNGYSELVPIPEPGTIFGAVALLGLAACRERKRLAVLLARRR